MNSKIPRGAGDAVILWLINSKQLTPDQAQDWWETMPNQCYFEYLASMRGKVELQTKQNEDENHTSG